MGEHPDLGVGLDGGLVCQNFPEHDREVTMQSGPFNGLACPECGRVAMGPDDEIPYNDEPHRGSRGDWYDG